MARKLVVYIALGLNGCTKKDTVTIDDEEIEGMTPIELEKFCEEVMWDTLPSLGDYGFYWEEE